MACRFQQLFFSAINIGKMFFRYDKREKKSNNTFRFYVAIETNNVVVSIMNYVLFFFFSFYNVWEKIDLKWYIFPYTFTKSIIVILL